MKKATKDQPNKSQIIRDFAAANPDMRHPQIVKALNEQGHKIHPALVIHALRGSTTKKKRKIVKRKPAASKVTRTTATQFDLNQIQVAAAFVKSQGSVEDAMRTIKNYLQIADLFK